jgi:hypothetical protein
MLSPKLMVARSAASEIQWRRRVEEAFLDQDDDYVEKVRYRPSQGGGTIAIPPVLKEQKDRKRHSNKGSDGKELQVVIRLGGEFIGARLEESPRFMAMIATAAQVPLQQQESEAVSSQYQWRTLKDARFGWRGDVLIRCSSKEEVLKLFAAIEGKTIDVPGGGKITIEVIPHVSLIDEAREIKRQ